ncbi:hypothetical protein [Bradyrhizobium sp. P5_C11_2]
MRLIQITSPEGAVSLLNVDQIKIIIPFGDGNGCTIQMIGDPDWKKYKCGLNYHVFIEHLKNFSVDVCYPENELPAKIAENDANVEVEPLHESSDHLSVIENLTNELEAERSRALGFRIVLCSVLTSIGRRSLDSKRFSSIITKAIEDVPISGPSSSRSAVLQLGEQMVLRSTGR